MGGRSLYLYIDNSATEAKKAANAFMLCMFDGNVEVAFS